MALTSKKILLTIFLLASSFAGRVYCQSISEDLLTLEKEYKDIADESLLVKIKKIREPRLLKDKALYYYLLAAGYQSNDKYVDAYNYYLKAKKAYLGIDSLDRAMDINDDIYSMISAQDNPTDAYKKYLDEFIAYAKKTKDPLKLARMYAILGNEAYTENKPKESLENFKKALALFKDKKKDKKITRLYSNIATIYNESLHLHDSALYYLNIQLPEIKDHGTLMDLCYNYVNQAASYHYMGEYDKAIDYLKMADNLPLKDHKTKINQFLYEFLYKNYEAKGDYKNAYKYLQLNKLHSDSINIAKQNIAISDIHTKYKTKEKELENTVLKTELKTNRILMYSVIVLLLAIIIIAFLMIKNSRRREKISRQEKQIEQQKLEKALKEYELNSIDMMLEGQEKERQRIANDLHDNLGSMLATLKLNFENLKLRKDELREEENKLYERTDLLIEEAYQKVRRIAHAKNAGVFATEGLIPAVNKLAEKISIPGKLEIQVIAFGFNERLENTLEITIFRTIQELATNIIKHSQATEATIHLNDHENNINIMIEDNGVGFDSKKISAADGMGLANIKKKIAHLGGSFDVDTTPGKGTTIIIDIPVND